MATIRVSNNSVNKCVDSKNGYVGLKEETEKELLKMVEIYKKAQS